MHIGLRDNELKLVKEPDLSALVYVMLEFLKLVPCTLLEGNKFAIKVVS